MNLPTLETINLMAVLPLLILVGWGCVVLLVDLFIPVGRKYWTAWLTVLGLVGTAVALLTQMLAFSKTGNAQLAFNGMLSVDGFAIFLQMVFLLSAILGVLIALNY